MVSITQYGKSYSLSDAIAMGLLTNGQNVPDSGSFVSTLFMILSVRSDVKFI